MAASTTNSAVTGRGSRKRPAREDSAPARSASAAAEDVAADALRGAVERSLHVLEILIDSATPIGIATIAQITGLEPNTVHRLLERLVASGYARKNAATKRYSAAAKALFPMSLRHPLSNLRQEAREQLRLLRERYDESVCLLLFVGSERVIVDFIQGRETLSLYETRLQNPFHASAVGMLLLNEMGPEERRRLLGDEPFEATTPNTVTSYAALEKELEFLRSNGYAIARETSFVGIHAVAAPIFNAQGLIGCIAATGSAHTIDAEKLAVLGEALKDSANLISRGAPSIKAVADFLGVGWLNGESYSISHQRD